MSIAHPHTRSLALAAVLHFCVACSDSSTDPTPTPATPDPIAEQINALWPAGANRNQAQTLLDELQAAAKAGDATLAEARAFALTSLTLSEFRAGHLQGGAGQLPILLDKFLSDVFAVAKLPAPPLSVASFGPDGLVAVISSSGGSFVTPSRFAGLSVPSGALDRSVLLVLDRLPDSTQYDPREGPLPTILDQYPLYYRFATSPAVTFSSDATVGLCRYTDSTSQFHVADSILSRIQLAHPDPVTPTTIEWLQPASIPFLSCTNVGSTATGSRPGIGGKARTLGVLAAVDPGAPRIAVSRDSVSFVAPFGGSNPASQSIAITNDNIGALTGLSVDSIRYSPGATGWATPILDRTSAPATLTLTVAVDSLASGSYAATVFITAPTAGNSPLPVTVIFDVVSAPVIGLLPSSITFTAPAGGGDPASQLVAIHNIGSDVLSGLAVGSTEYGTGAGGWLAVTLDRTTAPATLSFMATVGALPVGSYTATVPITATSASNSPQGVVVTLHVPPPSIDVSADSVVFGMARYDYGDLKSDVSITNGGSGALTGIRVVRVTFPQGQPGFFVAAQLVGSSAPTVLQLTLNRSVSRLWSAGTYSAQLVLGADNAQERSIHVILVVEEPPLSGPFTSIATGGRHACGLTPAGQAWCWGSNANGQVGIGIVGPEPAEIPKRVQQPAGVAFSHLRLGGQHSCGLTPSGQAWCWGSNEFGQLGDGSTSSSPTPQPVLLPGGLAFVELGLGFQHTCGLTANGQAWCWGRNNARQLGDGTTTNSTTPVAVQQANGVAFVSLSARGPDHTCAVTPAGTAWCWGSNANYALGVTGSLGVPTQVPLPSGMVLTSVSTGTFVGLALTSQGQAWEWGGLVVGQTNSGGQIGYTFNPTAPPIAVNQPSGVAFVAVSANLHECGLTSSGQAWCWGWNVFGQVGDGTQEFRPEPVAVVQPAGVTFTSVHAADDFTCALTPGGRAYCWGGAYDGVLGNGKVAGGPVPYPVVQ